MLGEYKQYIESIRNNLIQNDVDLEYTSLDSYQELFLYAFILEQVIEFYEILGISESEYKLDSKYIHDETREEKLTSISNKKYQQFLKGYKKLSAVYTRLDELRKKVGNLENISKEEKEFLENSVLDVDNMVSLYQSQEGSEVEYASHGIYIDEYMQQEDEECERKEDNIYNITEKEYRSHGIYIDEVGTNTDEESSSKEINELYVPHGVYLEDIAIIEDDLDESEDNSIEDASSEDDLVEDIEDNGIEYSDSEDDDLIYEEDDEGIVEEEYDDTEDGLVYEDEEEHTWDDEEVYEDDSQYQQDENDGIEYVDDEDSNTWSEDEVEEEDGLEYAEDDGLIYDADSEDGLEEPEELEEDQEDVESWLDEDVEDKPITSTPDMVGVNSVNRQSSSKAVQEEKDISDKLQDVTNKLINQGISMVKGYFK